MGGSSTPAKTDQVSKVELPAWVNEASQSNYDLAKSIASRPLEQFQGQTVRPLVDDDARLRRDPIRGWRGSPDIQERP